VSELKGNFYDETQIINSKYPVVEYRDLFIKVSNGLDERDYLESGIPYLRVANVRPNQIVLDTAKYVNTAKAKKGLVKKGQFLITRKGSFGQAAIYNQDFDACISSEVFKIDLNQKVLPEYISYINNLPVVQAQLKNLSVGAMMGSIDQKSLLTVQIPLPPLPIQQKLADMMDEAYALKKAKETEAKELLDSIDNYVMDKLGIKVETKEEKKVFAVGVNSLFGGRIDPEFNGRNKNINKNTFEFEKIIKSISGGATPKKDNPDNYSVKDRGIPLLRIQNITEDGLDFSDVIFISEKAHKSLNRSRLERNDLIMTITGRVGTASAFFENFEANINQHSVNIKLDFKQVDINYLVALFNSKVGKKITNDNVTGATRIALNYEQIKSLQIPLPPLPIQQSIATEVMSRRDGVKVLQAEAREILEKAKAEFEKEILS
jgi:type I restriction enzyme, S subunit